MHTLAQLKSGVLKGSISLKLSEGLEEFPREIFTLADSLEVLDLSGNNLSELPADFGRLQKLRILFCSGNPFTSLPGVLGDCPQLDIAGFKACSIETIPVAALNPNLRWLILTDNRLSELPPEIGRCLRMQKLMLAGNRITTLPPELSYCRNLALLRISANRLVDLPGWLFRMPRLFWLAFSGNDFSHVEPVSILPHVAWSQLHIRNLLGEGASGNIYQADFNQGTEERPVAVKVYKGAVTSDGLPEDEMSAAIAAGAHKGLVTLLGRLDGHPEGRHGLIMELIPPHFSNLGGPPSLQSCTRDVFSNGQRITVEVALRVVSTIASVAQHLHSMSIMHGDLYAHNTLVDVAGNTLISDFGAASFYTNLSSDAATALERIEVGAFGCLLEDVINLSSEDEDGTLKRLIALKESCLVPSVSSRPRFADIKKMLSSITA